MSLPWFPALRQALFCTSSRAYSTPIYKGQDLGRPDASPHHRSQSLSNLSSAGSASRSDWIMASSSPSKSPSLRGKRNSTMARVQLRIDVSTRFQKEVYHSRV